MLRFAESGGQYHQSNVLGPGIWNSTTGISIGSAPAARNGSLWAYSVGGNSITSNPTPSSQAGLIVGAAIYYTALAATTLFTFFLSGGSQCDLRVNGSGQLYFTRNGTNLGAGNPTLSANTLTGGAWHYIEFKAIFSITGTGTCEVYVDGALWLSLTSITNATTTAAGDQFRVSGTGGGCYMMDIYFLDTTSGSNTNYLGDITVAEIYPTGAGVNAAWTTAQATFVLSAAANASGGTTQYTGTITNGATPANAWQGFYFTVAGFSTGANNGGPWLCTASDATHITLENASGAAETHAGTAAFQNPLQAGIHGGIVDGYSTTNVGTRPPADNQYIFDSTANDKTDYAHQTLSLTGSIAAVVHVTQARKDDAGTRQIQQMCLSTGTEEDSPTITLSGSYQYFDDILEQDPHTSAAWTVSGFNAATFGVKEIT